MTTMLKLTRPDGSPIWFGGGFVVDTFPRYQQSSTGPTSYTELASRVMDDTRVTYAGVTHYVTESPQQVVDLIKALQT